MSLSGSISNAILGLRVTSHAAQLVSSNLANAMNEGYSPRRLELVANGHSSNGGVRIASIRSHVDSVLVADWRQSNSDFSLDQQRSDAVKSMEMLLGAPDDPSSLSGRIRQFDSALRFAESSPGSDLRLRDVASAAEKVVLAFQQSQSLLQQQRERSDREISGAIAAVNQNLKQVEYLNQKIVSHQVRGIDTSDLSVLRQSAIDEISAFIAVREIPRSKGAVSLVTESGFMLLEETARQFEFSSTNVIMPHMSVANQTLGRVTLDGEEINIDGMQPGLSGGRLQGLFEARDDSVPSMQSAIDALAFDLAERFNDLASDTTLPPNAAGLFSDAGQRVDPSDIIGLAGRLVVDEQVVAGEVWRLRDGLGVGAPGAPGNASLLTNMLARMDESRQASGGTIFNHASDLTSKIGQHVSASEQELSHSAARFGQFEHQRLEMGVDTDAELQRLLAIENSYAANAKMIQTVDEMLNSILRIT